MGKAEGSLVDTQVVQEKAGNETEHPGPGQQIPYEEHGHDGAVLATRECTYLLRRPFNF